MKQTAVEWLDSQLDFLHKCMSECDRINLFEQAKEMEKQQMIEMHDKGFDSVEQLNDKFAIEFAAWVANRIRYDNAKLYFRHSAKELLEIYKEEKGL
jgi:hypothetical protein